jgi:hypothetical protein
LSMSGNSSSRGVHEAKSASSDGRGTGSTISGSPSLRSSASVPGSSKEAHDSFGLHGTLPAASATYAEHMLAWIGLECPGPGGSSSQSPRPRNARHLNTAREPRVPPRCHHLSPLSESP